MTGRRLFGVGLVLLAVFGAACAPVAPRPSVEVSALFSTGTHEEASQALAFKVPRVSYVPPGAKAVAIEFSPHPDTQWVVQRYELGEHAFYIKSEPTPEGFQPNIDGAYTIKGRPAIATARRAPDGVIAEWLVYLQIGPVLHVIAGDVPAEELIAIASGLN